MRGEGAVFALAISIWKTFLLEGRDRFRGKGFEGGDSWRIFPGGSCFWGNFVRVMFSFLVFYGVMDTVG